MRKKVPIYIPKGIIFNLKALMIRDNRFNFSIRREEAGGRKVLRYFDLCRREKSESLNIPSTPTPLNPLTPQSLNPLIP